MSERDVFLIASLAIFSIGAIGLAVRRNPLVMFMCIELMLNAANLLFVTFTRYPLVAAVPVLSDPGRADALAKLSGGGPGMVFVVLTVAAAEAVVGLAIIITIFRRRRDVDVDELTSLRG